MPRIVNPVVGEVSPNLYAAAAQSNLSNQDKAILEQYAFAAKEAKRLQAMGPKKGREEFLSLNKEAQDWLRFMYPNSSYMQEQPGIFKRALSVAGTIGKGLGSPVIASFKVAGEYGKFINMPYSAIRQAAQGENIFSFQVWKDGYTGKDLYDLGALDVANKKHGNVRVFVAKQILAGKTPGEIWEEYGRPDEHIIAALTETINEPEKFGSVLEDVKFAQTSPGRDIARMLEHIDIKNGSPWGKLIARAYTTRIGVGGRVSTPKTQEEYLKKVRKSSGYIDAMYQVLVDPLTYITGGTSKLATSGERLTQSLLEIQRKTGSTKAAVAEIFQDKQVREIWDGDGGLGQLLEKFANGDSNVKVDAAREIKQRFPGYNNNETIKVLADAGVFNANSAEEFFGQVDNVHRLLSGRVDGVTYFRNGIATGRNQRQISLGIARAADRIFNPSAANADVSERARQGADIIGILKKLGDDVTGVNEEGALQLAKIDEDIKMARRAALITGRLMAKNPAGSVILIGDDAVKTSNNFTLMAQNLFTRDVADFLTYEFLDSTADEQIVILRNMYAAIMYKMGLHGTPKGKELMNEILNRTFNNKAGMTTVSRLPVPAEFAELVNKAVLKSENDELFLAARGIIHPSQVAQGVAALPFEAINQVTALAKLSGKNGRSVLKIVDGATRNKLVSEFINLWTIATLVPRLGIRSAIDETFFYALNAPLQDLFDFALGKGRRLGRFATAFTGSKAAVGPFKRSFNKLFRKGGPEEKISLEDRVNIPQQIAAQRGIPVEEVTHMMVREELGERLLAFYGKDSSINWQDLLDVLVENPNVLNSMANSLGARTSLSGRFDQEFIDAIFTPSTLTKALNDLELKVGKKFSPVSTEALKRTNAKWLTVAHFDAFYRMFVNNTMSLPNGRSFNPVIVFYSNDALRTSENFLKAKREILASVGVVWDDITKNYIIKDKESVASYLSNFGDTQYFRQKGLADAEIVESQVDTMLIDMRYTFHGSAKAFNGELFNAIKARYDELVRYEKEKGVKVEGKWRKATANLPFEDFEKVTIGNQPVGEINTAIEFEGFNYSETFGEFYAKFGDGLMEQMDRQVTGLYRQPAVMITYSKLREAYRGLEKEYALKLKREKAPKSYNETYEKIARRRYANIAMNEAVESTLKFVDNPAIRTNFAIGMRSVGRFYRATEDFWRRYYRLMREKPLQVIYRMRLANQGLEARGDIYQDDNGDSYLILPTDSIINSAVSPVLTKLTGTGFVIPQFSDITLKLRLINPSFSPDAGAPTLSGPVAGLALVGTKYILGKLPGELGVYGEKTGEVIDNFALGNFGENMDFQRAVVPLMFQNLRSIMPEDEVTREEASAMIQAISYITAYGPKELQLTGNPEDDPNFYRKRNNYIRALKIASHNTIAARAAISSFSPVTLSLRESKGIPEYYKNNGVISLRQEFFDLLAKVQETDGGAPNDPYEMALAMFIGKNPGKTVYTLSRANRNTKFIIQKTNEVVNWAIGNKKFIAQYGDAAWAFAPQIGDYTADSYSYIEALGLVEKPDEANVIEFLDRASVAVAKKAYFDIESREREALANTGIVSERRAIINKATQDRKAILTAYPLLEEQFEDYGIGVAQEEGLLSKVDELLSDPEAPISKQQRSKTAVAVKLVKDFLIFANDEDIKRQSVNFVEAKRGRKEEIQRLLSELAVADPQIRELNRVIFDPILSFYSRDTYRVVGGR